MGADQNLDWYRTAASTLEWWRVAGVDVVVEDAAFNWLAPPEPAPAATPEPALAPATALPETLEALAQWRAGPQAPDAAWAGAAIVGGAAAAEDLMVLVDCPERGDRAALLEGDAGRLFDAMLAAIGLDRAGVLLATVCSRRPTTGRIPRDAEARLAEIARHHVALAAPKRLLTLGDAATRAILGTSVAEGRGRWHVLHHRNGTIANVVASHHPRMVLEKPVLKADAWRDLLLLSSKEHQA